MKVIVVDDDREAIAVFEEAVKDMPEIEVTASFTDGSMVIPYLEKNPVDLVIMDVVMNGVDGIQLGGILRGLYPDIQLIYITGYENYAMDAIRLHAVTYLVKPYEKEELEYAIETAKLLLRRKQKRIVVKTFGHFDVFVDNKPIMFRSGKAKELLALLVDRQGGTVNTDQAICALWEDRPNDEATQNLCSKVTKGLYNELKEHDAHEMLLVSRGLRCVDTEVFYCDMYALLEDSKKEKKNFSGEYMIDYSWAEDRVSQLTKYI